jgi:malate dehydrogenase (oxaloacetate-decarboxylating)(NADP+)
MQLHGINVLRDPQRNLDSAFSPEERQKLGLRGLLPPAVISMDVIQKRTMMQFEKLSTPLEKYVFLMALQVSESHMCPDAEYFW